MTEKKKERIGNISEWKEKRETGNDIVEEGKTREVTEWKKEKMEMTDKEY
jgi:hypothetical protein